VADRQRETSARITDVLADCGIKLVASLPDDWICVVAFTRPALLGLA
jgi:hypothetical protein